MELKKKNLKKKWVFEKIKKLKKKKNFQPDSLRKEREREKEGLNQ